MKGIISSSFYPRKSLLLWTSQTTNMSREMNEGVMMYFKTIMMNLLTIVHLLVESITSLAKPKALLPWLATTVSWGRARARGAGLERLLDHRRMPY